MYVYLVTFFFYTYTQERNLFIRIRVKKKDDIIIKYNRVKKRNYLRGVTYNNKTSYTSNNTRGVNNLQYKNSSFSLIFRDSF